MKTTFLILAGIYLSGSLVTIMMLHREVKEVYEPKYKIILTWKVLKNTAPFYLRSWYGAVLIFLKRKYDNHRSKNN